MQITKLKIFILIAFMLLLISCKKSLTPDYLLEHPDVLQQEFTRCQESKKEDAFCDMVIETAEEFVELSNRQHDDPESFGKEIMVAESKLIDLKADLQKAHESLQKIKMENRSEAKLKEAQDQLNQTKEACKTQSRHVKAMLAVVSDASSPGL